MIHALTIGQLQYKKKRAKKAVEADGLHTVYKGKVIAKDPKDIKQ